MIIIIITIIIMVIMLIMVIFIIILVCQTLHVPTAKYVAQACTLHVRATLHERHQKELCMVAERGSASVHKTLSPKVSRS